MGDSAATTWKLHVWVKGRVQGVMFRESTRREAAALGLSGWVRNRPDRRVEAVFIGPREACERALLFVQNGPPAADVQHVEVEWEETSEKTAGEFEIRY